MADDDEVDVRVVQWPADAAVWESLVESGQAVLAVVAEGSVPPLTSDCCHEWMWAVGGEVELRYRLRQVALRAGRHRLVPPRIDEHGILSFGMRTIALPGREREVAEVLVARFGEPVLKSDLANVSRPAQLAMQLSRLRRRVRAVGLEVATVSGPATAYVMRTAAVVPSEGSPQAFDREVDARTVLRSGDQQR